MSDLPWNRFPDSPPPPAGESPPPATPGEPFQPSPAPVTDQLKTELWDGIHRAFQDNREWMQDQVVNYVKEAVQAELKGADVSYGHPNVVTTTAQGKELTIADARNRSWRTLLQGLAIDLFFALVALIGTLTNFDPLDKASWVTLAVLVAKTLVQTVMAYFMRLRITPTIKTPEGRALLTVPQTLVVSQGG